MNRLSLLFVLILFCFKYGLAQESFSSISIDLFGPNGSISFTVGQPFYSYIESEAGSISEGVQQPVEISINTNFKDNEIVNERFILYPNPTKNVLFLESNDYESDHVNYQMVDMSGKIIQEKKIISTKTKISLEDLEPSIYILRIFNNKHSLRTYKISKL